MSPIKTVIIFLCVGILSACYYQCGRKHGILPEVPAGAQAFSLDGRLLYSSQPDSQTVKQWEEAKRTHIADPEDPEKLIWFGRWTAYKGDFRAAIRIYTRGIQKFPEDARFYRHRGHRYITIREFDRAIDDFEKAVRLIAGKEDEIEPDGRPNSLNIPVSTLHNNIWYHLGLACYLANDLENALRAYREGIKASTNDDMRTATTHWLYMTLRRMGRDVEAREVLEPVHAEMNVIENQAYHRLCLFYKGELVLEELTGSEDSQIMNDAAAYGLANWFLYNGKMDEAVEIYESILRGDVWASFGYIAAEADYRREFSRKLHTGGSGQQENNL